MPYHPTYDRAYYATHRDRILARHLAYYADPARRIGHLVRCALRRAEDRGLPCEPGLEARLVAAPPTRCACCGRELDYTTGRGRGNYAASPSLDRVSCAAGYTVANVRVVCHRCNTIKSDASLADIEAIVTYVRSQGTPSKRTTVPSRDAADVTPRSRDGVVITLTYAQRRLADPCHRLRHLVACARRRAGVDGVPWESDLATHLAHSPTEHCACCGALLDYTTGRGINHRDRSPSLDRLRPEDGYTAANVRVVCFRCNGYKRDATLAELEAVAAYLRDANA